MQCKTYVKATEETFTHKCLECFGLSVIILVSDIETKFALGGGSIMARNFGHFGHSRKASDLTRKILIASLSSTLFLTGLAVVILASEPEETQARELISTVELESEKFVDVLIPLRDIRQDLKLHRTSFRLERRPTALVPRGSVSSLEQVKGMYSRSLILAGHPLHPDFMTSTKPANHIRDDIPDGYRAVTIRVDRKTSVEGWAWPGARVDVSWITRGRRGATLIPIVQNAEVVSMEGKTEADGSGMPVPSTVTLKVTASDSNKIQLASHTGSINLSLRGSADSGKASHLTIISEGDLDPNRRPAKPNEPDSVGTLIIDGERYKVTERGDIRKMSDEKKGKGQSSK